MSTVFLSELSDDDIEIIELNTATQNLLENPQQTTNHDVTKRLNQIQCPICFDDVAKATVTSCGHVFCLECIQQSIASSSARGQIRGKLGVGLCPLCRKKVVFKETTVLRLKVVPNSRPLAPPDLPS